MNICTLCNCKHIEIQDPVRIYFIAYHKNNKLIHETIRTTEEGLMKYVEENNIWLEGVDWEELSFQCPCF